MARPVSLLAALVAVCVTVGATLPTPAYADQHRRGGAAAQESQQAARSSAARVGAAVSRQVSRSAVAAQTPLEVTIDRLAPSAIPERGPVRVSGTITNTDDVAWRAINVYSFVSAEPMTTPAELAAAAAADPATSVGERIVEANNYATIEEIAPGASAPFSFRVARRLLEADTPGVYWFGVHALGESDEGRDQLADGRARTLLPMVPAGGTGSVDVAIVVPLRHQLNYAADGSVDDLPGWAKSLRPGGRLRALVDFGAASRERPVSWIVDPALLDVVRRLANGNPPRSLAATLQRGEADGEDAEATPGPNTGESPSSSPTEEPPASGSVDDQPQADQPPRELTPEERAAANAARTWLKRLRAAMQPDDQILALPYGDLDVSAAARQDPGAYQRARNRSGGVLDQLGLRTSPVVASPAGYLSGAGLTMVEPEATVVVSDEIFGSSPPALAVAAGHRMVVAASGAMAGGPGPDDPRAQVAMRQRLLSEAAVRYLTARRPPLVAVVPPDWTPRSSATFFAGLNLPWLNVASLQRAAAAADPRPVEVGRLRYPAWQAKAELDAANFASAQALVDAGLSLQNLLTLNNVISGTVTDQALGSLSYSARIRPNATRASTDASRRWIEERLEKVQVQAPVAVTLSSSSGRFGTTVRNELDQPVTVSLQARTDDRLRIEAEPRVDVPANGRATVLLSAQTDVSGIHRVTLVLTDKKGAPLGSTTALSIRSAQVSDVIWLFIGLGLLLLFGAVAVRVVRRVRGAGHGDRRRHDADPPDATFDVDTDDVAPARAGAHPRG